MNLSSRLPFLPRSPQARALANLVLRSSLAAVILVSSVALPAPLGPLNLTPVAFADDPDPATPTPTPVVTATPTNTVVPTATATSAAATATPTNTAAPATATPTNTSVPATATPTNTSVAATATPTNTSVAATATPTNTSVAATATATNTSVPAATATSAVTTPSLVGVAVNPSSAAAGSVVSLSFTINSPISQVVALGAGIRPNGGNWIYDGANDRTLTLSAGSNVVSRQFAIPANASAGSYDVIFAVWSAGFVTSYGSQQLNGGLTVLASTNPTLTDAAVSPASSAAGTTVTLSFTVNSPIAQSVSLGAGIRPNGGNWIYDGNNDRTLALPVGNSVVTRSFAIPSNAAAGSYDVVFALWSAGFGTSYGSIQKNGALTVTVIVPTPTATATPSPTAVPTPVLLDGGVSATGAAGTLLTLSFSVNSPSAQQVSLGAGLRLANGNWFYDPANDKTLAIPAGPSLVTRNFLIPLDQESGTYDVIFGLWNAGFGTNYGTIIKTAAVTISPPTTPLLMSADVQPRVANTGDTLTLTYTIYSPLPAQYGLGAGIGRTADNQGLTLRDIGNDKLVSLPAGLSVVTRSFYVRPDAPAGAYDIGYGLWDPTFAVEHLGHQTGSALITVNSASVTHPAAQPAAPALGRVVPNADTYIKSMSPAGGTTVQAGTSVSLTFNTSSTGGASGVHVKTVLKASGNEAALPIQDVAGETVASILSGSGSVSRSFALPAKMPEGAYDVVTTLVDGGGSTLDTYTAPVQLWVSVPGQAASNGLVLNSATLTESLVTLAPGAVNRSTTTLSITNNSGSAARTILRMRLKRPGDSDYIYDWANDDLVSVPTGTSTFTRTFALPLYLTTAVHDIVWELVSPSYGQVLGSISRLHALQIVNASPTQTVGVPILMFHNINPTIGSVDWVTVPRFTGQMDYLKNNGYTAISGDDLYAHIYKGTPLPAKPVWITFDDSYQNVYDYAAPILQARGLKGTLNPVTQYTGQQSLWDICCEAPHLHMTWDQLNSLKAAGTANLGSRTRLHSNLNDASPAAQLTEIWGSQRDLVDYTGTAGGSLAYPYNLSTDYAEWATAHSGFRVGTVLGQVAQYTGDARDIFRLTRIGISDGDDLTSFVAKLNSGTPGGSLSDGVPPVTTAVPMQEAATSGWYGAAIQFALGAVDTISGVDRTYYSLDGAATQIYTGPISVSGTAQHTLNFWSTDRAGNTEDRTAAANTITVKVDDLAPTITGNRTTPANSYGWNNTAVGVTFSCADVGSGVVSCTGDGVVSSEGANQSLQGVSMDLAGNTASLRVEPINIDKTAPQLASELVNQPNASGWYRTPAIVHWTATDGLSGIDQAQALADSSISTSGAAQVATVTVQDRAGNATTASSVPVKVDVDAPRITGGLVSQPNAAGWFNSSAYVHFTCADDHSGIANCPSDQMISSSGAGQSASATVSDIAGNTASTTLGGINVDGLSPVTTAVTLCSLGQAACGQSVARVALTAVDQPDLSGVKEIRYFVNGSTTMQVAVGAAVTVNVPLATNGSAKVRYYAVDIAGNIETAKDVDLLYDTIAPTVSHTLVPAPNASDWNNTDVTVYVDAIDNDGGSGVNPSTVSPTRRVTTETSGLTITSQAADYAGNVGTNKVIVRLDKTLPTISGAVQAQPKVNGWYNDPVVVKFTCADSLSGVASCPNTVTLTENGSNQSVTGRAVDRAGNSRTATISGIKLDSIAPTLNITGVDSHETYRLGRLPTPRCSASDSGSGLDGSCVGKVIRPSSRSGVGTYRYTATAKDKAGNVTTKSVTYTVAYSKFQYVDFSWDKIRTYKAGSKVPIKFWLRDEDGRPILNGRAIIFVNGVRVDYNGNKRGNFDFDDRSRWDDDDHRWDDDDRNDRDWWDSDFFKDRDNDSFFDRDDNYFRHDNSGQYGFELNTRNWNVSTLNIKVLLDDGKSYDCVIALK